MYDINAFHKHIGEVVQNAVRLPKLDPVSLSPPLSIVADNVVKDGEFFLVGDFHDPNVWGYKYQEVDGNIVVSKITKASTIAR